MQSSRSLPKRLPRTVRICSLNTPVRPLTTTTANKMSFFPRTYFAPEASFTPLFRLLDDFDSYSREVSGNNTNGSRGQRQATRTFSPRFDVKETENTYELHGELPGIEKDNVHIEFTEPQTIVIRGRTERHYTSGTPPAGLVEDVQMSGAITEAGEKENNSHKATVSDEETEVAKEQGNSTSTEVTKAAQEQPKEPKPTEKIWVSERSVGEFSRTFNFPSRIDQEGVSANLANGVLSVTVPKAKKHESRRIAIQ